MRTRRDDEFDLATGLAPLAGAWKRLADAALASLDVSNSQGWALVHLARLGRETRQGDLARAIGITEASLVPTLRQLEAAGFVTRSADPDDRRSNQLKLTDAGAALAIGIDERLALLRTELLDGVSDADLAASVRVIAHAAARIAERRGRP